MEKKIIGEQIKEARQELGISQAELARSLNLSRAAVSALEGGKTLSPTIETMANLSSILKKPVDFFYSEYTANLKVCTPITFRSFASARKRDNEQVSLVLKRFSMFLSFLIQKVRIATEDIQTRAKENTPETLISDEKIESYAKQMRDEFGLGDYPIINLIALMENHGIICFGYDLPETIDSVNVTFKDENDLKHPVIIYNNRLTYFRQRFTLAHELGHIILHSNWSKESYEQFHAKAEQQAHRFANAFMMPFSVFRDSVGYSNVKEAVRLKGYWRMSVAAIGRRMFEVGKLDRDHYKYFYIDLSKKGWRKEEPGDNAFPPEKPYYVTTAYDFAFEKNLITPMDIVRTFNLYPEEIIKYIGNDDRFVVVPNRSMQIKEATDDNI